MNIDVMKIHISLAEKDMDQQTLAKKCGISRQNLSSIIRRGTCTAKTAGKLAAGLGIPVSELIKEPLK